MRYLMWSLFALSMSMGLFAEGPAELTVKDVGKIMNTMFEEHVSQKKMTDSIMEHAVELFVNEFDVHHEYLLASEVAPFFNLSETKIATLVHQYEFADYSFFEKMMKQFQTAIYRARGIRKKIETSMRKYPENLIPSNSLPFPETLEALTSRITARLVQLISAKQQEKITPQKAIQEVENAFAVFEDNYLYVDKNGKPLSSRETENLFAFHLIRAFTKSLDAHSSFLNPEEANSLKQRLEAGTVESSFEKVPGGIIGKIILHSFYEGSNEVSSERDIKNAIEQLSKQGPIIGLVLDLRDNRGGFLLQAVKVAGLFIKSGVIVISKTADGKKHYFRDMDSSVTYSGPLVILTSKATASAAEIVAQSLKDYGEAIIVGDEHTYGKGTLQMQTVTGKESDQLYKITVGRYYSVSGDSTQLDGVKADIVVPSIYFYQKLGEKYLASPVSEDSVPPAFDDRLVDIDPSMKEWYIQHYLPDQQKQITVYKKEIPELQKRSTARIQANAEYQRCLNKLAQDCAQKQSVSPTNEQTQNEVKDLQLQEAVNVLKDIIQLSKNKKDASIMIK